MNETIDKLSGREKCADVLMQADIVDQANTNQQSNMTLSAYSVITQSDSTVRLNNP